MKYIFCQTVILLLNKFSFFNSLRKLAKMFGAMAVLGLLPLFFRSGLFVELSLYSVRKSIYHQDSRSSLNQLKSPVYGAFGFKVSPKRGRRQLEKTSCTMLSLSVFGKFLSKRFISYQELSTTSHLTVMNATKLQQLTQLSICSLC